MYQLRSKPVCFCFRSRNARRSCNRQKFHRSKRVWEVNRVFEGLMGESDVKELLLFHEISQKFGGRIFLSRTIHRYRKN